MPTPLPPKGTVLQTAEFADSLYSPVLVAFVSCVSSTFFQPARSGSHLYSAHRNTVRSGHQVMVLHTLVGIRHLRGCLTLAFCTLIVSQLGRFVKGFLEIFSRKFVSRMVGSTQLPRTVRPPEGSQLLGGSLPLTSLVYHRPSQKSTGNVVQIRDFSWQLFCSFCLLTNWLGCGIMEIRGQDSRGRAAEN